MVPLLWAVAVLWGSGSAVTLILILAARDWEYRFPWKTFWNTRPGVCLSVLLQAMIWPLLLGLAILLLVSPKLRKRF